MKYISLLLSFLIFTTSVFGQVNETWKASTFTLPGLGVLTKAELYRLQGVTSNVQSQLDLKELLSNKATSLASPDNTKYPTTQAVSTGLSSGLALKEDTANKTTTLASPDNVKFPTTQAVATGLGLKQDTITGAASTITTSNLSTSKAMVTDGSGKAAASSTVDTTELGYLDGVTSPIQTQINTNATTISSKVSGPASATDEAVARYDLTTGKLIQDSKVTIDDNGLLTTQGTASAGIYNQGKDYINIFGDGAVTTGSNATLDITNAGVAIGVANSSLVSISNISPMPAISANRRFTLVNNTGNSITIVNDTTTGTATTGIYTGTGTDITLGNKASLVFIWNSTRWTIIGGSGAGGSGPSDLDIAFSQDFETAKLTDFTQTGLTIDATSQVHLKKSALLTHNASTVQSFKQIQTIDPKFRNKTLTLKVDCKSTATTGNVTVSVFDETNSTTLLSSTQLACGSTIDSYYASYTTASTTASVSYTVSALVQSGSPTTYVDDIVSYILKVPTYAAVTKDADSMIRLDTHNGYGSTGTKIPRFTNMQTSIGDAILYQDSSVNGASFTALKDGVYSFMYTLPSGTSTGTSLGFSKNSSSLSTNVGSLASAERLAYAYVGSITGTSAASTAQWTGYLAAGDVIRPHTDGVTPSSNASHMTATYQGSLRQISVNKNSLISIPSSELILSGAVSRGSAAPNYLIFPSVVSAVGDSITSTSDATNGQIFSFKKKGRLTVAFTGVSSSAWTACIYKNGTAFVCDGKSPSLNISTTIALNVTPNDTIAIQGNANPSSGVVTLNFVETDVQVSVSNTLPQFSDSDTVVKAAGNAGQAITANVTNIPFTTISDSTGGAWTGSSFTIPESGVYDFNGAVNWSTSAARRIETYIDGSIYRAAGDTNSSVNSFNKFAFRDSFTKGQVVSFRDTTGGTLANTATYHFLNITKIGKPNVTGVDVTPFVNSIADTKESFQAVTATTGSTSTQVVKMTTVRKNTFSSVMSYTTSATAGDSWTCLQPKCNVQLDFSMATVTLSSGSLDARVLVNDTTGASANTLDYAFVNSTTNGEYQIPLKLSGSYELIYGDVLRLYLGGAAANYQLGGTAWLSMTATASNSQIVTPVQSFSTDVTALTFKSSDVTSTDAIGSFSTYNWTANTNTKAACGTAPTQSLASMSVDGILLTGRAYNATGSCATPSVFKIQVGKGFKGRSVNGYISSGKTTPFDWIRDYSDGSVGYGTNVFYDEKTGILTIDAGLAMSSAVTIRNVGYDISGNINVLAGYFVVNMSKTPTLSGISYVAPRVAWLSDVKANGTAGGSSTAGAWQTRTLNTILDSSSFITTFSGNQFTLPAGTYYIDATAPAYAVNGHRIRLRNITAGSTILIGPSSYAVQTTPTSGSEASVKGEFTITSPTTFEIQHYTGAAQTTNGLGFNISTGENEIYTQLMLTKVK